ncbi:Auxin response factor 11, partial [Bienertia sinuspersici]
KMITPEFTTSKEPPINEHPRGRPKCKASTKIDPSAWEYSEQKCFKKVKGLSSSQEQSFSTCSGRARGRPRKTGRGHSSKITSESVNKIPSNILPFVDELPSSIICSIHNIHNADGDGNCEYRVVAHWIYEDEYRWLTVCQELGFEIEKRLAQVK